MTWASLPEDSKRDWLAKYVTSTLTERERLELSSAALRDDQLFEALARVTPLRTKLNDQDWLAGFLPVEREEPEADSEPVRRGWFSLTVPALAWAALILTITGAGLFFWKTRNGEASRYAVHDLSKGPASMGDKQGVRIRIPHPAKSSQGVSSTTGGPLPGCTATLAPSGIELRVDRDKDTLLLYFPNKSVSDKFLFIKCPDQIVEREVPLYVVP